MVDNEIFGGVPRSQQTHVGFLHNDDVHSFNDIISLLRSIAGLPDRVGLNIALKVDYYQQAVFVLGTEAHCLSMVEAFSDYDVRGNVETLPPILLSEERVVEILGIVTDLCHKSDALRRLACDSLSRDRGSSVPFGSFLVALMHSSSILSRIVSTAMAPFHFQLFVSVAFKERFTIEFTRHYSALVHMMTRPSHTNSRSVLDYSVQVYTIPDMILRLCRSQNLLGIFFDVFRGLIESQLAVQPIRPDNEDENLVINGLRDMVYIVTNQGVCRFIYESRTDIIQKWLEILRMADGLDKQVLQRGVHVDYESIQWWFAFRVTLRLQPVSKIFLEEFGSFFVASDLERIIVPIMDSLPLLLSENRSAQQYIDLEDGFQCPVYDITLQPVSMHFPLRRFVIELTARFALKTSCCLSSIFRAPSIFVDLVDDLMRAVAFIAHIRAGLWVLNGSMLLQQATTYERIQARDCMFDPDLLALQCSAVVMGPRSFLFLLSYRFLLHDMFFPGQIAAPAFDDSVEPNKISIIVEIFMHLLVAIVVERARITDDPSWGLRREIVHWLLTSDLTHSDLLFRLGIESPSPDLRQVLSDVACYLTPRDMESGKYQVRKEAVAEMFDPLFIKYTDSQRETATATYQSQNHRRPVVPILPFYSSPFIHLSQLLTSFELYQILHRVLGGIVSLSSRLVLCCLRLIGAGLRDAQAHARHFPVGDFIRNLTFTFNSGASLFEMLCCFVRDDVDKVRDHVDYIRLLIDGISSLSPECHLIAQNLLSNGFSQQQLDLAQKADERRRRRDAARAAALGAIRTQIEQFSNAHTDSLQDVAAADDTDNDAAQACILCRSNESPNDLGLLTWMGKYHLNDLLLPSNSRCRHRRHGSDGFIYTRDCGHAIHLECYKGYMESLNAKESAREHYEGLYVIDLSKGEFVCPLCKSHANTLLPVSQTFLPAPVSLYNQALDTKTWINTCLPLICQRLNFAFSESQYPPVQSVSNCLDNFAVRLTEFAPNGSFVNLLADNIVFIEIQLRDGSLLSDRQLSHLRFLSASASQKLDSQQVSTLASSLVPLRASMTVSLRFVIECCLSFLFIDEPLESVLRLVRIGFMVLCSQSAHSEFNEEQQYQFAHASSLTGNASRQELFTMPYLRQVAILISALSENGPLPDLNSHSALLQYLNLFEPEPDFGNAFQDVSITLPLAYVKPTLVTLPESFMALFDAATRVPCSNCGKSPIRPAICLICGDIMCSSKDCGEGIGALTLHTSRYLGDMGLYLSINQGSVFLICNGFSCEFSSPYLDEHGEEDIGLHRGRPLFFDAGRYEKLRQLVVRLEIGSSVSRKRSYQSSLLPRNAI